MGDVSALHVIFFFGFRFMFFFFSREFSSCKEFFNGLFLRNND